MATTSIETPTTAVVPKGAQIPAPVLRLLQGLMPDVYKLLPPDITSEQFRAACWLEITGRPSLYDSVIESLRDAIIYAATYGLMPGRDCHFLPFKQKRYGGRKGAQCVTNYFGILRVLDRSGKVRRAFAHPVQDGDEWMFDMFQDRPLHRPAITLGKKPGRDLFYYGAIMFKNGTCAFEVLSLDELDKIEKQAPGHESGPWLDNKTMMRRKTCLKRVAKYVQLTPAERQLLDDDDARLLEDIPPARHQRNLTDLFDASNPTAYVPVPSVLQPALDPASADVVDPQTGEVQPRTAQNGPEATVTGEVVIPPAMRPAARSPRREPPPAVPDAADTPPQGESPPGPQLGSEDLFAREEREAAEQGEKDRNA